MKDNHSMPGAESSFRRYISSIEVFNAYFTNNNNNTIKQPSLIRYQTGAGEQAQLDWKESLKSKLINGEIITVNIFVLLLSYSRFRIYRLSISKTRDILLNFMSDAFESFGSVPQTILTDNMKSVMDKPRTKYQDGKINNEFQQFASDYGFITKPCTAGRPETKAKVESPMKILDELKAYNGDLDIDGLVKKLTDINDRENIKFHKSYQKYPILFSNKEKDFLCPLPQANIRNHYYRNRFKNV